MGKMYGTAQERLDAAMAKRIREDSTFMPTTDAGPLAVEALRERGQRQSESPGNTTSGSRDSKEEKKDPIDQFITRLAFTVRQNAIPEPTVKSTWDPAAQRNQQLEKEYNYDDLGNGMCGPTSFASSIDNKNVTLSLQPSLSSNTPSPSFAMTPQMARQGASFKDIADGAFSPSGPSLIPDTSIKVDLAPLSTLPGGIQSTFGPGTHDVMPMTFDSPTASKAKGAFAKAAKPVKAPEPTLNLIPSAGSALDLGAGRADASNIDRLALEMGQR